MATIDEAGAAIKTLLEYKEEVDAAYLAIDPGWNINPESPDGQAIAVWVELLANLDENVLAAYRSVDPQTAIGQQLDRIARISGLDRQIATFSTATVEFSGVNGTVIPQGTEVRNSDTDTIWTTDQAATISSGTATVQVTCEESGPEPAGVGDLSVIATPVAGISGVTNPNAASLGDARESDAVFRTRRRNSVAAPGSNQVVAVFGAVANVENVLHTRVYENYTGSTDGNGLDPHSMAVFVNGGDGQDIGDAIATRKNPGAGLNAGNFANEVTVSALTETENPLDVSFFRPVLITAGVSITVSGAISTEQVEAIKQAIVDYASADLFNSGPVGFDQTGFGIGEIVPVGKIYTPVNSVVGNSGYVVSIFIGEAGSTLDGNPIDPGFNGLVVFDTGEISVTVQ